MHRARQDRAADDDGVASRFILERLADEFANASNVGNIKVSIDLGSGCRRKRMTVQFREWLGPGLAVARRPPDLTAVAMISPISRFDNG